MRLLLDKTKTGEDVSSLNSALTSSVVGQDRAIKNIVLAYQKFKSGMAEPGRTLCNFLFMGPTGVGKTQVVESFAEATLGSTRAILKISCAEFQQDHEISKLIGSPAGYIGHRTTEALLSQQSVDRHHKPDLKLSILLFDEIEKASSAVWNLLLGIMDRAEATLGDVTKTDFSNSMIFMTSNVGSREMSSLLSGGIGYATSRTATNSLDQKLYSVAMEASKRKFSPEFMNRIDRSVVFRNLTQDHLARILDLEFIKIQDRVIKSKVPVLVKLDGSAKEFLLEEDYDPRYGARHIRRSLERHLVNPLSSIISSGQVDAGSVVDVIFEDSRLQFYLNLDRPMGGDSIYMDSVCSGVILDVSGEYKHTPSSNGEIGRQEGC